jgi:hypothetical protein
MIYKKKNDLVYITFLDRNDYINKNYATVSSNLFIYLSYRLQLCKKYVKKVKLKCIEKTEEKKKVMIYEKKN